MHVLPVGRSILTRIEEKPTLRTLGTVLKPESFDRTTNPYLSVAAQLRELATNQRILLDRFLTAPQLATLRGAEMDVCAEWNSVARAALRGTDDGRGVVLIASDTNEGLRSAMLVAARCADDVRYVDEPMDARDTLVGPGEVWVFRIPGLDFTKSPIPDETWYSVGSVGHVVQRTACTATAGRWTVTLHLTGGYKAVLPYLLVMAEGIKSVFRDPDSVAAGREPTVEAVSIHEHRPDVSLADQFLVELPVRWLRGTALTSLRKLADYAGSNANLPANTWAEWRGQWVHDGGARLSEAGMILTRVL